MPRATPSVTLPQSAETQPDRSRWASLAAWSRLPAVSGGALCAMVAVSYYPALSAGFVWDDMIFTGEPAVQAWSGLWNIWFSPADIEREGHYWPILYTTFWLEHKLWGLAPVGSHLVNVLLYMANVLLLWHLLRRLAVPGAWAVAAVFAVHPMHVEPVVWTIGRKDMLCALFYLTSALCWIRSVDDAGDTRGRSLSAVVSVSRPGLYVAALGLFAAAMLSKSVAVTLPVAFAILLWWNQGRVTWTDARRIAPFFLVALCIAAADLSYYASRRSPDFDYGLPDRALIAARALWFYAGKLAWPVDLAVIYPSWEIDAGDPLAWGYVIAAAAVAALLWVGRHRLGRGPLAGAAFFAVTLSPMLGFVDYGYMGYSFVADRYAYLAGVGVMAVLVGAAARGANGSPKVLRVAMSGMLVAVLAGFGALTWRQAGVWRDDVSLYTHILSFNPEAIVHGNLSIALIGAGRPAEALAAARIALERRPDSARAYDTLGDALLALDRLDEAGESFRRALELDPDQWAAHQNLAETLRRQGRFVESVRWYRSVLDIDPEFLPAHDGMGKALLRLGQHERAIETWRGALEIDPGHAPAHAGIGYALYELKHYEEALESLTRGVSLQPDSFDAADRHAVMGRASWELGRKEAAEHFEKALRLYEFLIETGEANAGVHANVGAALYYLGRRDEALRSLDRAIDLDPALARQEFGAMRETLREEQR